MNAVKIDLSIDRLAGGGFIAMGGLVAIIGLIWLAMTGWFTVRAAKTLGVVIEMERVESSKGGPTFHPVFTFTDGAGLVHTQRTPFGSSSFTFEPGEKVTVLYDPSAPKNSKIDSFETVWLGPLLVTGIGLLSGGFACFWLALARRWFRQQQLRETG